MFVKRVIRRSVLSERGPAIIELDIGAHIAEASPQRARILVARRLSGVVVISHYRRKAYMGVTPMDRPSLDVLGEAGENVIPSEFRCNSRLAPIVKSGWAVAALREFRNVLVQYVRGADKWKGGGEANDCAVVVRGNDRCVLTPIKLLGDLLLILIVAVAVVQVRIFPETPNTQVGKKADRVFRTLSNKYSILDRVSGMQRLSDRLASREDSHDSPTYRTCTDPVDSSSV